MLILDKRVQKAINFANKKHNNQMRKGTDALYSVHPITVGVLLSSVTRNIDVICAGILHDTLEDTETTEQEIEQEFGELVLKYVKEASESDKSLSWEERKILTFEKLSTISKEGLLVTLADKTHNLNSIIEDLKECEDKENYWNRFNKGLIYQKWYYTQLFTHFNKLCRLDALLTQFNRDFIEFKELVKEGKNNG